MSEPGPSDGGRADRSSRRLAVRLPLRLRTIVGFGLTALLLAAALAAIGYTVVRQQLVDERQSAARRLAYSNARVIRTGLNAADVDVPRLLSGLQLSPGSASFVRRGDDEWFASDVDSDRRHLPSELRAVVSEGHAAHQRVRIDGEPAVIVGVPIAAADAEYFQIAPMADIDETLSRLASSLALAGAVATALAIGVGIVISGKVLRPLRRIADVAGDIGRGDLGSRLDAEGDRDLAPLVVSFNAMLDDLQARISREARFASDVAHEVRGPLASFGAAVDVVNRRRDELPDRAVLAVDALQEQVRAFNALVLDLLEISRFDARAARLQLEPVDLLEVVHRALDDAGCADVAVRSTLADSTVNIDRRRLHQMLANLIENARRYAGGPTSITVEAAGAAGVADGVVRIAVEDHGPGVPIAERDAIFDRFARGLAAERPDAPRGTGLGLALVAEHAELLGGRVFVEDAVEGGARFVIEIPAGTP